MSDTSLVLTFWRNPLAYLPGFLLAGIVVAAAYAMHGIPGLTMLSPMILAVVVGMVFSNVVPTSPVAKPGIQFCQKQVLRWAIVLLGFQLTIDHLLSIGLAGLLIVVASLAATFAATLVMGRALGVDRRITMLIAAGTSVCGASAIVATNLVAKATDEDVSYALACITLFGTVAMFAYPALAPLLGLNERAFGLWAGASIHEIAQVISAGFQHSPQAGELSTISKLARVGMLAPLLLLLAASANRGFGANNKARVEVRVPWFVLGFFAVVALNTAFPLTTQVRASLGLTTTLLLSIGLAATGIQTDISQLRERGARPLLLSLLAACFIGILSLVLIKGMG